MTPGPMTVEELYAYGELTLDQIKRIKERFTLKCNHCKNEDIAIMTETDDDGFCESCSSPYSRFTIKCKACGQAISVRS